MTTDSVPQTPLKRCKQCQNEYPATAEYFRKRDRDTLRNFCLNCARVKANNRNRTKGVKARDVIRQDGLRRCSVCRAWLPATRDVFITSNSQPDGIGSRCLDCNHKANEYYRQTHREELRLNQRKYRAENPDKIKQTKLLYQKEHREEIREYRRAYREQHRPRLIAYTREWRRGNPDYTREYNRKNSGKYRVWNQVREARKRSLPNSLTNDDWARALDYFSGCCAVCGRQLRTLFGDHTVAMDHWIPLSAPACPGTVASNIVPLCHGKNGCNNRKHNRNPIEFVHTEFGKRKARRILLKIEQYFNSLT